MFAMRCLLRTSALIVLSCGHLHPDWGRLCPNFTPPMVKKDQVQAEYSSAVLRIECNSRIGTGSLIERTSGFIITAAHVVEDALADSSNRIVATGPSTGSRKLPLVVVGDLRAEGIDLALLRLVNSADLSGVRPLDVTTRVPRSGAEAFTMGYPRGERILRVMKADATAPDLAKQRLEVNHSVFPGSSGSPLIDERGRVAGICVTRVDTHEGASEYVARYVPMALALGLLDMIPASRRVQQLNHKIRTNSIVPEQLAEALQPRSTNVSNIELMSWASMLAESPDDYVTNASQYFPCPLLRALYQRHIDISAERLTAVGFGNAQAKAEIQIAVGRLWSTLGMYEQGLGSFGEALQQARIAQDPGLEVEARFGAAQAFFGLGETTAARFEIDQAVTIHMTTEDLEDLSGHVANLPDELREQTVLPQM